MPRYDVECIECGIEVQDIRLNDLDKPAYCSRCGNLSERLFPLTGILGFQPFEGYWDEALGCDVSGRRERRQIMAAEGLQEAGDKRGGARNFDRHAPDHIKPRPLQGKSYSQVKAHEAEQVRLTPGPDIQGEN